MDDERDAVRTLCVAQLGVRGQHPPGDFETGLGAAAHMGQREIALFLLENGASLDLFAAAMLGYVDVVREMLATHPELRNAKGAHGIPLVGHAQQGGEQAKAVLELLEAS